MKDVRILALASTFTLGLTLMSVCAQAQMTDQSSSTTTTTTTVTQQTVTTPNGQMTIYTTPLTQHETLPATVSPTPEEQGFPAGTGNQGVNEGPIDYSKSPFWPPRDWNYIEEENATTGGG